MKQNEIKKSVREMGAIEKLRTMVTWANFQDEGKNICFRSVKDIETAYDYCQEIDMEFVDMLSESQQLALENRLGYCLDWLQSNN